MTEVQSGSGPMIYPALIAAMQEIGSVQKLGEYRERSDGPVQYRFRGVDAVVNAVGPALRKVGIVPVPKVLEAARTPGTTKQGGSKMTTVVKVRYEFTAADGSHVDVEVEGEANDTSDKGTGKAMSVAYRIALLQLFSIPTDDPDPDAVRIEGDHTPPLSQALRTYIWNRVDEAPLGDLRDLFELLTAHVAADVRVDPADPASAVWWELWAKRYLREIGSRTTKDDFAALWKELTPFGVNFRLGKGETVGSRITDAATAWRERNLTAMHEAVEAIDAAGSEEQLNEVAEVIKSQLAGKTLLSADSLALLERLGNRRTVLQARKESQEKNLSSWSDDGEQGPSTTDPAIGEEGR